jgi:hypothetical protein
MNGSPSRTSNLPAFRTASYSALGTISSISGCRIINRAHVNPIGSARRITWHRASSKRREISLVAAQWAIFGSLRSGVQRRTAAHTGDFAHFSAKYQKPRTRWRREVDSNPRYREGFYGRELGASQREEAPDLFWPSPAVMISAIGSCKPLIPSRQPNRSRSRARRRSLKTHFAHSVRVGSPVRFRGLGNHKSILFVGVVMSGAGPDA